MPFITSRKFPSVLVCWEVSPHPPRSKYLIMIGAFSTSLEINHDFSLT